jgi:hypothetical protein
MIALNKIQCNCNAGSPPGPVRNLILMPPITATTLTIMWDASSGFPDRYEITYSYIVKRCLATGGPLTINISDVSMRSYTRTLSDLNEDSSYTITVTTINTAGSSMVATVTGNTSTAGEGKHSVYLCYV